MSDGKFFPIPADEAAPNAHVGRQLTWQTVVWWRGEEGVTSIASAFASLVETLSGSKTHGQDQWFEEDVMTGRLNANLARIAVRKNLALCLPFLLAGAFVVIPASPAAAAGVFDGSPGTNAPPSTLGPFTMTPFAPDTRANGACVTTFTGPTGTGHFSISLKHTHVGLQWGFWSNGYTGDVYMDIGPLSGPPCSSAGPFTITLPPSTHAFYFYAEPDSGASKTIIATTNDGTTSGPISADGHSAKYFGFYDTSNPITTITVSNPDNANNFAIGEFGIGALPPVLTKSFGAASIPLNGTTSLNFNLRNPNSSVTLTGVSFTDTLPAGLSFVANSGTCGGKTWTAAGSLMTLTGATLAPSAACNFSPIVTGTSAGVKNNATSFVTSDNGGTGNQATASLLVIVLVLAPTTLPVPGWQHVYPPTTITASGGTPPYTFAVTSGSLPTGLNLSSNGVLSGTPTVSGQVATFTVTATDAAAPADSGSQAYTLTVNPCNGRFRTC
jgi:uncharacterized repeat protein (TIGR01451 family)